MLLKVIVLAGGCFWGTEHFFRQIDGVTETQVGYANGQLSNPTYRQVCTGTTGHAEAVRVTYDAERLPLEKLIACYLKTVDPTAVNRQGNDVGPQYRTGIYSLSAEDKAVVDKALKDLEKRLGRRVAIESEPLVAFWPAETYHQRYLEKNPGGYCHIPPDLFEWAAEQ